MAAVPRSRRSRATTRRYGAVAAALRGGTPPPVTAEEAAAALDVLEAARVSAREGRTVAVGEES